MTTTKTTTPSGVDVDGTTANDNSSNSNSSIQLRVSFHLAKDYCSYNNNNNNTTSNDISKEEIIESLQVPKDSIVVPNTITRKGLSLIINHLLGRQQQQRNDDNDDDENNNESNDDNDKDHLLPAIPFEFMIGSTTNDSSNHSTASTASTSTNNRLLRIRSGGLEREIRKLGTISLEETIPIIYFPAQLPPIPCMNHMDTIEPYPDWISTIECTTTTTNNNNNTILPKSLLCTGCYDGSIVIMKDDNNKSNDENENDENLLSKVCTIPLAHDGPIQCMSVKSHTTNTTTTTTTTTTSSNDSLYIVTGSIDQTLRIHHIIEETLTNNIPTTTTITKSSYTTKSVIDCSMNGHNASISSVDTFLIPTNNKVEEQQQQLLYVASGDWDGNICIWKYNVLDNNSNSNDENNNIDDDDEQQVSSKKVKKSKIISKDSSNSSNNKESGTNEVVAIRKKKISAIHTYRAHTTKVSGISWGNNYEKTHNNTLQQQQLPNQLITCSWDHSIKVWDVTNDKYDPIVTMNGLRVITCMDTSYHVSSSNIIVTGHPDCMIRLWDIRSNSTTTKDNSTINNDNNNIMISDTSFQPRHKEWISCVKWSPNNPYHIISTSYDNTILLWDIRTSTPLHTINMNITSMNNNNNKGVSSSTGSMNQPPDKGLCVCYHPTGSYIYGGGTDGIVKKYKL